MNIICINTRDELNLIDLDLVACINANGNYSNVMYIDGNKLMVSIGLSQFESIIKDAVSKQNKPNTFIRLGRSVIVNNHYLSQINVLKQTLTLSDRGTHAYRLTVPKNLLKSYKELIRKSFIGNDQR
ncbi:MAG: LytTR family transcriptional regulator DNA-binding domain-containing protein [Muribaculaceae bacterium]|nr:LytTR family transcriptional regulator DNA-binding domain-containing protein [Muribaculaceae bacterium]